MEIAIDARIVHLENMSRSINRQIDRTEYFADMIDLTIDRPPRLSLASRANCASLLVSKRREFLRNLRRAMLLDRLRNGPRFASVHAGDLHLGKRAEQRITSRIALQFASAAFRFRYLYKLGFERCASRRDRFQIACDLLRSRHIIFPSDPSYPKP